MTRYPLRTSRSTVSGLLTAAAVTFTGLTGVARAQSTEVTVFNEVELSYIEAFGDERQPVESGVVGPAERHAEGRAIDVTVTLPTLPRNLDRAMGIRATLDVEPIVIEDPDGRAGAMRPSDPWTRLGRVSLVLPDGDRAAPDSSAADDAASDDASDAGANADAAAAATMPDPGADAPDPQVELIRFTTPFGGPATYEADLTSMAPLLDGEVTLRIFIDTYTNPGWRVTLSLRFDPETIAYRRPAFARSIFRPTPVTAIDSVRTATVTIPDGLALPRLRIVSTGHSVDGRPGDEFITRTHILRIDGEEIARWRPWREGHVGLRGINPTSGRGRLGTRTVWSTDFDRSGWLPGLKVDPLIVPVPELTPGEHEIEIEIIGIRPVDPDGGGYGYWWLSAALVADEPWPDTAGTPAP